MAEATDINTQSNVTNNASLEHLSGNISDEEALLFSLSLTDNNAEEIEREMDLAIADIQECTTGFLCVDCNEICKSKGGLTLHRRKKHVDGVFYSASSTEPGEPKPAKRDWNKLAKENLSCKSLCDLVEETKAELTQNNLYPEEFVKEIKDSPQFTCSEKDDLYKEIIKLFKDYAKERQPRKVL
ncbi:---NA--- [Paramuricea clavata]|uniref:---NA n=1 Tax=Paramuricea clavata TaxID=317549 RepID=A0A7D9HEK2_PARCT|nr:---NA--- [Paramuricea clavata]